MSDGNRFYDAAAGLLKIARQQDRELPPGELPDGTHWLISPEAWMTLRSDGRSADAIQFTGVNSQTFMGLPAKIGLPGMQPAIDLVLHEE